MANNRYSFVGPAKLSLLDANGNAHDLGEVENVSFETHPTSEAADELEIARAFPLAQPVVTVTINYLDPHNRRN